MRENRQESGEDMVQSRERKKETETETERQRGIQRRDEAEGETD